MEEKQKLVGLLKLYTEKATNFDKLVTMPVVDDGGENSLNLSRYHAYKAIAEIIERYQRGDFRKRAWNEPPYGFAAVIKIVSDLMSACGEESSNERVKFEIYRQALSDLEAIGDLID